MTAKEIEGWIDNLDQKRERELDAIGLKVRNAFVIPFCNKYRLEFSSGMGAWCFWNKKGDQVSNDYYDSDYWVGRRLEELKTVCDILYIDCGNNSLGEYITDYKGVI